MAAKLCVVTGTSSGIGRAVAEALLAREWKVVGVARREAPIRHPAYRHLRLDLGDVAALEDHFERRFAEARPLAGLDRVGLVNNAAVVDPVGPASRLPAAGLARAFAVNAVAPLWLMGWALRSFRGPKLRIVNVSSGAAHRAYAGWSAYCTTKAALRMAGQVVGAESEAFPPGAATPADLAVVSYEPGVVDTAMQAAVRSVGREDFPQVQRFLDLHAQGKLVRPEGPAAEIARLLERDDLPVFSEARFGA